MVELNLPKKTMGPNTLALELDFLKKLDSLGGSNMSEFVTLVIPPNRSLTLTRKKLEAEINTANNIKSRVHRNSVLKSLNLIFDKLTKIESKS